MHAFVIADLGFGDAGKGLLTDFLVRRTGARMVVRYNGGAQAGHNVVTPEGRHHTFAQFGAGTLVPGTRTFLSRNVVVHPAALLREEAHLRALGVTDAFERLRISGGALAITPYHQALNRLRELARGAARHGSCGAGVGETVTHDRALPDDAIRVRELGDAAGLRRKLARIREYACEEVRRFDSVALAQAEARPELALLESIDMPQQWIDEVRFVATVVDDDRWWANEDAVIFEGAQGVLLDEWHGFHPHTTWSTCTTAPATTLLSDVAPDADVCRIGVLRTYAVRHGAGPLPTESSDVDGTPPDHNTFNAWQGAVRRGWFDGVLARYALEADGNIDVLAVTHLDWLAQLGQWTYCDRYQRDLALHPSPVRLLEEQEQWTARVAAARPVLQRCAADEETVVERIESMTGKRVAIGSRGPSAAHVFIRPGMVEVNRGADRRREVG